MESAFADDEMQVLSEGCSTCSYAFVQISVLSNTVFFARLCVKGECYLQCHTARLIGDCNHRVLHHTNLLH